VSAAGPAGVPAGPPSPPRGPAPLRAQVIGGLALAAFGLFAYAAGGSLAFGTAARPGAGFFPLLLSAVLVALAAVVIAQGLAAPGPDVRRVWGDRAARRRVGTVAGLLLLGIAAIDAIGFAATVAFLCAGMTRLVARRGRALSLAFAVAAAAASWFVFQHWLRVNLPPGWVLNWLSARIAS
jgi:hypothetical protein